MRFKSDISLEWVAGYRPECPVCRQPTTAIIEGIRPVEVVELGRGRRIEQRPVAFPSPCECRVSGEQSLAMQRAAVAAGGVVL